MELDDSIITLELDQFIQDVRSGLRMPLQKRLSSKYFYDAAGSQLFDEICLQPEYYQTRTESEILSKYSAKIVESCNDGDINLVELGSGSATKTKILIRTITERQESLYYFPIDISASTLWHSAKGMMAEFPRVEAIGIPSSYDYGIDKVKQIIDDNNHIPKNKLIVFFGSSIGNFDRHESKLFLQNTRTKMDRGDSLLIGFDLQKDPGLLNAAYNDKAGVTARFNLNILARINRELGGTFDLDLFEHQAFYNKSEKRIEMHLVSRTDQKVRIEELGESFYFRKGETIHTENSYKYSMGQIKDLAHDSGFEVKKNFTDKRKWFDLALLSPAT